MLQRSLVMKNLKQPQPINQLRRDVPQVTCSARCDTLQLNKKLIDTLNGNNVFPTYVKAYQVQGTKILVLEMLDKLKEDAFKVTERPKKGCYEYFIASKELIKKFKSKNGQKLNMLATVVGNYVIADFGNPNQKRNVNGSLPQHWQLDELKNRVHGRKEIISCTLSQGPKKLYLNKKACQHLGLSGDDYVTISLNKTLCSINLIIEKQLANSACGNKCIANDKASGGVEVYCSSVVNQLHSSDFSQGGTITFNHSGTRANEEIFESKKHPQKTMLTKADFLKQRPHGKGVYVYFDNNEIVYIGCTSNSFYDRYNKDHQHMRFDRVELYNIQSKDDSKDFEDELLTKYEREHGELPRYNRQRGRRKKAA